MACVGHDSFLLRMLLLFLFFSIFARPLNPPVTGLLRRWWIQSPQVTVVYMLVSSHLSRLRKAAGFVVVVVLSHHRELVFNLITPLIPTSERQSGRKSYSKCAYLYSRG